MKAAEYLHKNCRNLPYPRSNIERFPVSDKSVYWKTPFSDYKPPVYESPILEGAPWSDPPLSDSSSFKLKWNRIDGDINRISYTGEYQVENNVPLNPFGRTGVIGRGLLGRWGPNHAADAIVTRWSRDIHGNLKEDSVSGRKILQMIAIQRRDNNMWAMPGGMLDLNENPYAAVKREFIEEALRGSTEEESEILKNFFDQNAKEIFAGYVDDPRNTDNAWMETTAFNFHDENGDTVKQLHFKAGDDAKNLKWIDLNGSIKLYASHRAIVHIVVDLLKAHW